MIKDSSEPEDCSLSGRLQYVEDRMMGEYLWAEYVEPVSTIGFTDPTEYLRALRYDALDRWSYARDLSEADDWFSAGAYVGGGYVLRRDADDTIRFALVYPEGPAGLAGLARGDALLGINGTPVATLTSQEAWTAAFGPVEDGAIVVMEVRSPGDEASRVVEVVLGEVVAPPILSERVFTQGDRTVGYFMLTAFIEPADDALDDLFRSFSASGVDTVVVDLRYNGGGLLAVGRHLASLLAPDHAGEVYQTYWYNEARSELNTETYLDPYVHGIAARDVVVLTTGATASASEMLAFGLEPYRTVSRMGGTTLGKPVGMNHYESCELFVAPITFQMGNRDHRATYFDGLAPDCGASDLLTAVPGSDGDPMMTAASSWLNEGRCPEPAAVITPVQRPLFSLDGWGSLRGGGAG